MTVLLLENNDLRLFYLPHVNDMMKYFVHKLQVDLWELFYAIYGIYFTVFNVHQLLHLDDLL